MPTSLEASTVDSPSVHAFPSQHSDLASQQAEVLSLEADFSQHADSPSQHGEPVVAASISLSRLGVASAVGGATSEVQPQQNTNRETVAMARVSRVYIRKALML